MLTQRTVTATRFTRADIPRLVIAAGILILALAAILGSDILPEPPLDARVGQLASRDIVAPRALDLESLVRTKAARDAAAAAVEFQYDFTTENAIAIAAAQQLAFEDRVAGIDTTFAADLSPEGRKTLLENAVSDLSEARPDDAERARRRSMGERQDRVRTRPGCHPSRRAARHRGGGDA